jgi:DNA helicase-2/ATP-dependent DNA helicase PcrA
VKDEKTTPGDATLAIPMEEEALFSLVSEHLATRPPERSTRPPPELDYEDALLSLRDQIASARLEDAPALIQQMERLQGIAARRAENVVEPVDPKSPYFGHLKLRETGRGVRDVLIGKTTHIDGAAGVRIVDWRHAPVSQIYYRYEEGTDYEETFGEREVEGTVLARRTVTIDEGELLRISSPQGTFVRAETGFRAIAVQATELSGGQGTAVRPEDMAGLRPKGAGALGVGASFAAREDRHLPEIAALLDPRQFELISRTDSGIVAIQGGAGSGKTTIGVHRMAFLAFNDRRRFTPDKMLVIVGSPALRAYISEVLPALGIGGVLVETFAEWAATRSKTSVPLARCARGGEHALAWSRATRRTRSILHLFEQRAAELLADPRSRRDSRGVLALWAEVLTDQARVLAAFAARPDPEFGVEQIRRAWRWCADRCPAVVDLDPGDRAERKAADDAAPEDDGEGLGADQKEIGKDDRAVLDPEDDALLLRAYQLLRGELKKGKNPLLYEHLFVDEAQDLAPVNLAVLLSTVARHPTRDGTLAPSVTLAGDTAQRLHMDAGFRDWSAVLEDLGLAGKQASGLVAVEPLRIAYRSTREVLVVARDILGPLADPTPPIAHRSGAPVEHHHFPSPGAAVAFLADAIRPLLAREPRATLALLARHPEQADVYYEALKMAEIPNLRRIRSFEFAFRSGVEVTEIRQVKGLEYDYVVLVDVNASTFSGDDESRHLLHIGATRAAHQLWLISTGKPSRLIDGIGLE